MAQGRSHPSATRERLLAYMRERAAAGQSPTVREVQRALGFRAVESAREQLEKLVAEGRLRKQAGVARGYQLTEQAQADPAVLVPLLGRVQAGPLTEVEQEIEGYLHVTLRGKARAGSELFALRVRGDSMRDAGILDGDLAIVRRQATAESGELVVAAVEGAATLKRLRRRGQRVELWPANPDYAPIALPAGASLLLLGVVLELRRYFEGGVRPHDDLGAPEQP